MDAVECPDNVTEGSTCTKRRHLRSFTAFRMTEGSVVAMHTQIPTSNMETHNVSLVAGRETTSPRSK